MVSCNTRGELAEFLVVTTPSGNEVEGTGTNVPGMLNTLFRKSTLMRRNARSVILTVLNADADIFHCIGPSMYWFCIGSTKPESVVRCKVPFCNGTNTVFVS